MGTDDKIGRNLTSEMARGKSAGLAPFKISST